MSTVIQVILRNFSRDKKQNVKLKFDPANAETANYYLPHAEMNQRMNPKSDLTFWCFQKLRPYEDWGMMNFEFLVDDED